MSTDATLAFHHTTRNGLNIRRWRYRQRIYHQNRDNTFSLYYLDRVYYTDTHLQMHGLIDSLIKLNRIWNIRNAKPVHDNRLVNCPR